MMQTISGKPYLGATPDPAEATREAMAVVKAGRLPVVEIFYSLQGEGGRTGQATVFVRFAGCNLACEFCDTDFRVKETYTPGRAGGRSGADRRRLPVGLLHGRGADHSRLAADLRSAPCAGVFASDGDQRDAAPA